MPFPSSGQALQKRWLILWVFFPNFSTESFPSLFWGGQGGNTTSFLAIQKSISVTTLIMSLPSCWDGNCWERKQNVAWIPSEDPSLLVLSFWAGYVTLTIWFFSSRVVDTVFVLAQFGVVVGRSTGRMWVERVCHPKARRWQELSRAHPLCGCHQRRQKSQIWSCHFLGSPPPFRMVTSSISFPASSPTVLPSQQEARPKPHGHLVVFDQTHLIHARAFHALFSRPGELISSFYFHLIKYFCSF